MEELNIIINQQGLINSYRTLHSTMAENSPFPLAMLHRFWGLSSLTRGPMPTTRSRQ